MKMIQVIRMAMGALAMAVTSMAVAQTTLRIGTQLPETHPSYLGTLEVKKKLEELSKGSMTLRIFPNSQLGDFKAMVAQVQAGELDAVSAGYPDMSYIIPELKLIGAPYVIANYDHLKAVVKGPYGKKMDAKFQEKGIRVLDVWYEGARHTTANKPINSIDDMKGLKLRTPNVPFLIAYAKAVGATPAPVAFAEVYLALQTKQVDALTGHFIASSAMLLSEKTWAKLTPEQRNWVTEATLVGGKFASQMVADKEKSLIDGFKARGITFTQPDTAPFRAAMKGYYDELEAEFGKGEIQKIVTTK